MNDWTPEDAARLARRKAVQEAGIDLERDMCAHDYVNGHGCEACDRTSRRIEWLALGIVIAIVLTIAGFAGWTTGWIEAVLDRIGS